MGAGEGGRGGGTEGSQRPVAHRCAAWPCAAAVARPPASSAMTKTVYRRRQMYEQVLDDRFCLEGVEDARGRWGERKYFKAGRAGRITAWGGYASRPPLAPPGLHPRHALTPR